MANPTTNYSFAMPTNTDLVKDLPADFEIFGQAVDTQMKTNADAAIAKTIVDAKGDLIVATAADTVARLASSASNGDLLTVDTSTASGLKWAAPSSGGGMTLISTTTLTGATVTLSSIPATYNHLQLIIRNYKPAVDNQNLLIRFNNDSNANRHAQTAADALNVNFADTSTLAIQSQDDTDSQSLGIIDFYDYANTTTWKFFDTSVITNNATTSTNVNLFRWRGIYNQTTAISSLVLLNSNGNNFTSGTALLYGVK